jgi:hypothetical protein
LLDIAGFTGETQQEGVMVGAGEEEEEPAAEVGTAAAVVEGTAAVEEEGTAAAEEEGTAANTGGWDQRRPLYPTPGVVFITATMVLKGTVEAVP